MPHRDGHTHHSRAVRRRPLALVVAAISAALIGCASSSSSTSSSPSTHTPTVRTQPRAAKPAPAPAAPPEFAIRDAMLAAGPDATEALQHVAVLADPFLEGRAPDTEGNHIAASYIEFHFRALALRPAFEQRDGGDRVAAAGGTSYQEPFTVRGGLELKEATLAVSAPGAASEPFSLSTEFHPLGFSANGRVTAPVAFVGYSIEKGPDDYTSYTEGEDLAGKFALVFRYEPLGSDGKSRWGNNGEWSDSASLPEKMQAAQDHGAAGVLLVNPPGVNDARAEFLETHQSTVADTGITIPVVQVSPDAAARLIETLCAGGPSHTLAALRARADEGKPGAIPIGAGTVSLAVDLERDHVPTSNVGAILPGRGALADQLVIIGAHYDHLGYGHFSTRDPQNDGKIHPGADDNASGIAALLLAARRLKDAYDAQPADQPARSILFLAFSGEEMGLLGSAHFAAATALDAASVTAMLNMDMVGRVRDRVITVNGVGTSEAWTSLVERAAAAHDLEPDMNKAGIGPSDHTTFYQADIPVLHFFSGTHDDYHTVGDTFEKLNYVGLAQTAAMVADIAQDLALEHDQLTFVSTGSAGMRGGRTRAKVRLGIMPASYGESDVPGVVVGDVFEGTSAADAGFQKADRLIRWGGEPIPDVNAMVSKLADAKPGDVIDMVVVRDGAEVVLRVTLHARLGNN